jgi:hypothetical protein
MNDFIVLSGISGYLNNLDVPTYCKFLYQLYLLTHGKEEDPAVQLPRGGEQLFDFALPGSTHGLRLSNNLRFKKFHNGDGMKLIVDRVLPVDNCDVFYKPFYRRDDFDDERYKPVFSPTVFSGQTMKVRMIPHYYPDGKNWSDGKLFVRPYVLTAVRKERYDGTVQWLEEGREVEIEFRIPDTCGDCIAEVGFHVEASANTTIRCFAMVDLLEMTITGKPKYHVATALCKKEFLQQTPFALNHGDWKTDGGVLLCAAKEPAQAYTGNYYATDVAISTDIVAGKGTCMMVRAAGARRYVAAGFLKNSKIGLRVHEAGAYKDYMASFPWVEGKSYLVEVKAEGNAVTMFIDGKKVISKKLPNVAPYGMVGFAQECAGNGAWRDLHVAESGEYPHLIP